MVTVLPSETGEMRALKTMEFTPEEKRKDLDANDWLPTLSENA